VKKRRSTISLAQFAAVIAITIAISLLVDISRRVADNYRLGREETKLERDIEILEAMHRYLKAYKEYVQSDEFVEWWAREVAKKVKEGEVLIKPLLISEDTPSIPDVASQREDKPCWREWWELFFEITPPSGFRR
jgi:cell division protein FtsB